MSAATPGRNDPCPCGIGKKYKKCCLPAESATPTPAEDPAADRRARTRTSALRALLDFGGRPEFAEALAEALEAFSASRVPLGGDDQGRFAFYYLFDHVLPTGRTIAEEYLAQPGRPVAVAEQRVIRRRLRARLRPYEVEEVRLDEGLRLRDLWTKEDVVVAERSATSQLHRFDLLLARVYREEDGLLRIEGGPYLLPVASKDRLLKTIKAARRRLLRRAPLTDDDLLFQRCAPLLHRLWLEEVVEAPMPTMATVEGDPMVFGKVLFDILDEAALRSALDRHPALLAGEDGHYDWVEETPDVRRGLGHVEIRADGRLVLEVMSRSRAEIGRSLLEGAAGAALRHRSTRFESVASALERRRGVPEEPADEGALSSEAAASIVAEFKDRHYRTWPDEPLPALDGFTPREAARTAKQRARLIDLLKDMENQELRAVGPDAAPYDFGWIWKELGLMRPS